MWALWELVSVREKRPILYYFKTYTSAECTLSMLSPHIRNIHISVLFMSLVVTVTYARTSSLTPTQAHQGAVNCQRDIPAGNSFNEEARVGCICVYGSWRGNMWL